MRRRGGPPEPEQQVEALAPEPGADRHAEARPVLDAELAPHGGADERALGGVEALEVDAVVDDRDPLARYAVIAGHLVAHACRHGQHPAVAAGGELPPLEPQNGAMVRAERRPPEPRRPHAREVRPVRASPDAHHVLPRRASEANHHVPPLPCDEPRSGEGERHEPGESPGAHDGHAVKRHAGEHRVGTRAEHVHVVPAPCKSGGETAEIRLGAAPRQPPVHEGDPHHASRPRPSHNARRR